jgi:diacylglycerol kinase (ATP)
MLNDRPFFNIAGVGVDARVAGLFNVRAKGTRGRWPYILLAMREAVRYRGEHYEIELDGRLLRARALLVAFANGAEYGNGVRLSSCARPDDGWLEGVVIEDRAVLARFWDARHLIVRTVDRAPRVVSSHVRRAVLRGPGPLEYHVDGEPGMTGDTISVTIRPGALRVRT